MKEQIEENNSYSIIRVLKITGEKSSEENVTKVKAIITTRDGIINIISKRLQVFLRENKLSGGIMDLNINTYEIEIIKKVQEGKLVDSYIVEFIDCLAKEFEVDINNNFNELEVTQEDLSKLLEKSPC